MKKKLLVANYFLSNISVKKYQNRLA